MTGAVAPNAQALIAQAASRDEVAFARIVAVHHEDMRRVCAVICGDDALAEDAVQAAWPIAWRKLRSVHNPERLRPWLVSVAVNEAKQLIRKHRRRRDRQRGLMVNMAENVAAATPEQLRELILMLVEQAETRGRGLGPVRWTGPARPFFGVVGVAPPDGRGALTAKPEEKLAAYL